MAESATLSPEFQISIPESVRLALRWEAGRTFAVIPRGRGVLLMPVPDRAALAGLAEGAETDAYRDRLDRF